MKSNSGIGELSDPTREALAQFRAEWASWLGGNRDERRPSVEQAIAPLDEPSARGVLTNLLAIELHYRRQLGEEPLPEEYLTRFPQHRELLDEVFRGQPTQTLTHAVDLGSTFGYLADDDRQSVPRQIGKYRVERPLGKGGQATTYLVHDPDLEKHVVVKRYHSSSAGTEHFIRQEGRALARVDSDYVARCLSLEQIDGQFYLVMEYIRGAQLDEHVRIHRPSFEELASLLARVAEGLCDVHDVGLLHCDIKPANIVVRKNGMPCLVDFGVAVRVGSASLEMVGGTLPYMSPEQANEDWESLGQRSDVFGLGAVLYALLTGRPPYVGPSREVVLEKAKKCDFVPPSQLNPDVPRDLERICLKAMSPNLGNRYRSAALLQSDLKRFAGRPKDKSTAKSHAIKPQTLGANPYRGLTAFTELDAELFFGRDDQIERLWEAFRQLHSRQAVEDRVPRILPILGPSGSGKSSLARAGLVATLARRPIAEDRKFRTIVVTPGAHPLEGVATALARLATDDPSPISKAREFEEQLRRPGPRGQRDGLRRVVDLLPDIASAPVLLVIDQCEEVYTLCQDPDERSAFVEGLIQAASDPGLHLSVVLTLRTDFLGETQDHNELNAIIAARGLLVPVMSEDELRQAIATPASRSGYDFDPAIVALLVDQSHGREGVLPLLQFALSRIWEGLRAGVDPAATLKQIGGVGGALAGEAQRIYDELSPPDQDLARRIFLGLVQLGEGTRDTRRRAALSSLVSHSAGEDRIRSVIERFSAPGARLITLSADEHGQETVEITHEALFDHWKTLNQWLDESRGDIRLHRRLEESTAHWFDEGRPNGLLWRSPDLDILREFAARAERDLTSAELEFFRASDSLQREEQRAQRRRMRAYKIAAAVFAVMTVAVVGLALHAQNEADRASQAAERAIQQSQRANSAVDAALRAEKVAVAEKQRAQTEEKRANEERGRAETQATLAQQRLEETQRVRYRDQIEAAQNLVESRPLDALAILENPANCPPHLREFVWGHYRYKCDREVRTLFGHREFVWAVKFSPDGRTLATAAGGIDSSIKLWDVASGALEHSLHGHLNGNWELAFSPDGTLLASCGNDPVVKLWEVASGKEKAWFDAQSGKVMALAFSPDGSALVTGGFDGSVRMWRVSDQSSMLALPKAHTSIVRRARFSPDGKLLLTCGDDRQFCMWDLETKERRWRQDGQNITYAVAFPREGDTVICGAGGAIQFRKIETGDLVDTLRAHDSAIYSLVISADEKLLASASYDKRVCLWDLPGKKQIAVIGQHNGYALGLDISPDQSLIASGGSDESVVLWRTATAPFDSIPAAGAYVAVSSRGKFLAPIGARGEARLIDAANMRERARAAIDFRPDDPVVFSPDERHAAIFGGESKLLSFSSSAEPPKVQPLAINLSEHLAKGNTVSVSPNAKQLLAIGQDGSVIALDVESGQQQWEAQASVRRIRNTRFVADYSADSSHVALLQTSVHNTLVSQIHSLNMLDAATGNLVPLGDAPVRIMTAAAVSSDGREIAAAVLDPPGFELVGWTLKENQYVRRRIGQAAIANPDGNPVGGQIVKGFGALFKGKSLNRPRVIQRMTFREDGRRLALLDTTGNMTIQDVETWRPVDFEAQHVTAAAIRFSEDGKQLVSCGLDGLVRFWSCDEPSSRPKREVRMEMKTAPARVSITPDLRAVRALDKDSGFTMYDMATGKAGELLAASGVAGASGFNTGSAFHIALWTPKTELRGIDDAPEREPSIVSRELGVAACFSPDSSRAAIQTATAIEIWDVAARNRHLRIEGATVVPLPLAFSSDWSRLVTTPDGGSHLEVWELATGQSAKVAAAGEDSFVSTSFSPDGSILAAAELGTSKVRLWRLDDFTELAPLAGHADGLVSVRFLNDGKTLASADAGGRFKLWDVTTWRERLHLYLEEISEEGGISVELNNIEGRPILSRVHVANDDLVVQADATTVQVWNGSTGKLRAALNDGGEPVFHVKASPDGRILLLKHTNHTATLWDVETARLIKRLGTASGSDLYTAFSADGKTLAVATDSGKTIEFFDPVAGALLHRVTLEQERACDWLRFAPDNRQLLATCADDSLRVYGAEYGKLSPVSRKGILAAAADAQAERLALADDQGTIVIVRLPSGSPLHAISAHNAAIRGVAFSPDGNTLASASDDETCRLWDVESGELLRSLENTRGRLGNAAFMPGGDYVAAPHYRGITIWNAASGETKWHLEMGSFARAIAFSPDGKSAIATESLSPMRLWKLPDGPNARPTFTNLGGHETGALCAAYSPDGKVIATGGADGKICLWTAEGAAQPNGTLEAHGDWVHSLAFSADGKRLVSAGGDQKLGVWDVAERKKLHSLNAPGGSLWAIGRLAAGDEFVSAGSDGVARIWKLAVDGNQATLAETRALQNIDQLAQSLRPVTSGESPDGPKESIDRIDVAVEETAVRLVSRLFDQQPLPDDVVDMIRRDESLNDAVRNRSIILAKRRRVDVERLNNLAWHTALLPGKTSQEYEQALRLIQAACRLEPENGMLVNTLGAAEYRAGQFDQAIATLSKSAALNRQKMGTPAPHDLVFMAMAQKKLGQTTLAAATLKQAQAIANARSYPVGDPAELYRLLDEAAHLIEKAQE